MRASSLLLLAALAAVPAGSPFHPAPVVAQQGRDSVPCPGHVNLVRISNIPPGMMDKFMQAVQAQKAWYKGHGMSDQIEVMRVLVQDPATKAWKYSDTQAITTHIQSGPGQPKHDAAWDAFVAKFAASSKIEKTYVTCTGAGM
jgi:hypothetical protein